VSCSNSSTPQTGSGGAQGGSAAGGAAMSGGAKGDGGTSSGGQIGSGGATGSGGAATSGGATSGRGGATGTGVAASSGGTGGRIGSGGTLAAGGASVSTGPGGQTASGDIREVGGSSKESRHRAARTPLSRAAIATSQPEQQSGPEVQEVCNYLDGLTYARKQLHRKDGLPLSIRLLNETHRRRQGCVADAGSCRTDPCRAPASCSHP
jgi:hypothetical protein